MSLVILEKVGSNLNGAMALFTQLLQQNHHKGQHRF